MNQDKTASVIFTQDSLKKFKVAHKAAADAGKYSFEFEDHTFVTDYGKYVIEYLDDKFGDSHEKFNTKV